jgi:3-methylfumaryl-CoA hydratase
MWAGGKLNFVKPIRVGEPLQRSSLIGDIALKNGASGPLVFVQVVHELSGADGVRLTEEQNLVYRDESRESKQTPPLTPAPDECDWERTVCPDSVLLFRYSAATFNAHRIHFDRRYAVETERYPELVVQGPLIATLLLEFLQRHTKDDIASFSYRGIRPLFAEQPFKVCGKANLANRTHQIWAHDGHVSMRGEAIAR